MNFDAILIPGGGLSPDGSPPPWVAARLDRALEIPGEPAILTLSGGTTHKPPLLDERGFPILEAAAGARYLIERGCKASRIFVQASSYDTIGDAYFARVMHASVRNWRRLLIITSEFHIHRVEEIFRWIFSLDGGGYELSFCATPDLGLPEAAIFARRQREIASLAKLASIVSAYSDLASVHQFLFTEHQAYCAHRRDYDPTHAPDPLALETY